MLAWAVLVSRRVAAAHQPGKCGVGWHHIAWGATRFLPHADFPACRPACLPTGRPACLGCRPVPVPSLPTADQSGGCVVHHPLLIQRSRGSQISMTISLPAYTSDQPRAQTGDTRASPKGPASTSLSPRPFASAEHHGRWRFGRRRGRWRVAVVRCLPGNERERQREFSRQQVPRSGQQPVVQVPSFTRYSSC